MNDVGDGERGEKGDSRSLRRVTNGIDSSRYLRSESSAEADDCDESWWPDVADALVCGNCKVLVDNFRDYG